MKTKIEQNTPIYPLGRQYQGGEHTMLDILHAPVGSTLFFCSCFRCTLESDGWERWGGTACSAVECLISVFQASGDCLLSESQASVCCGWRCGLLSQLTYCLWLASSVIAGSIVLHVMIIISTKSLPSPSLRFYCLFWWHDNVLPYKLIKCMQ